MMQAITGEREIEHGVRLKKETIGERATWYLNACLKKKTSPIPTQLSSCVPDANEQWPPGFALNSSCTRRSNSSRWEHPDWSLENIHAQIMRNAPGASA
ncbi:hypothetical protein [Desulfonatronum parangueonense]